MNEIDKEEFVKRNLVCLPEAHYLYSNPEKYASNREYEYEQIHELSMVLLDASKWESLKKHIANYPPYKQKDLTENPLPALMRINLERNRWFEELERMVGKEEAKK